MLQRSRTEARPKYLGRNETRRAHVWGTMKFFPLLCSALLLSGCHRATLQTERAQNQATRNNQTSPPSETITRRDSVPDAVGASFGLSVPRGFRVNVFARGLNVPRRLIIAPNDSARDFTVFVAESGAGRVTLLRAGNGDGSAQKRSVFLTNLRQPYGLAWHPNGFLYIGETDKIVRVAYRSGQTVAREQPQIIAPLIADGYNNHWTRNLLFSRDGSKLYATVGSSCNTCEEKSPIRAAILQMKPDGSARRVFASGLRNPVGLAWRPNSSQLWTVVNERDNLGDDVPPDYLTSVRENGFYGWPYAYTNLERQVCADPSFGALWPAKVRETIAPDVPVQAHSAALGLAFYPLQVLAGAQAFPADYRGDAFLAYHGSWNRSEKTGYKIVRVHFEDGVAKSVTDFVRGPLRKNGGAWGRPVDCAIAPDGSLLFSDDGNGIIWRVSYGG